MKVKGTSARGLGIAEAPFEEHKVGRVALKTQSEGTLRGQIEVVVAKLRARRQRVTLGRCVRA